MGFSKTQVAEITKLRAVSWYAIFFI